jgi:hypothetical protein
MTSATVRDMSGRHSSIIKRNREAARKLEKEWERMEAKKAKKREAAMKAGAKVVN